MPYENTEQVKQELRRMSDDDLEKTYIECLEEYKRGGPEDGDQARSDFLRALVEAEIDYRFDVEGPREAAQ